MTKESARQESTEIVPFEPTEKMEAYLNRAVELLTVSPSKVSRDIDVDRSTWYLWLKSVEGFEDWFYEEYKKRRKRIIAKLDEIGMRKADKDFRYWEAMNRKVGDLPSESGRAGVSVDDGEKVIKLILDIPK